MNKIIENLDWDKCASEAFDHYLATFVLLASYGWGKVVPTFITKNYQYRDIPILHKIISCILCIIGAAIISILLSLIRHETEDYNFNYSLTAFCMLSSASVIGVLKFYTQDEN